MEMAEGGEKVKGENPNSKDGDMEAEIQRLKDEVPGNYYGKPEMDATEGFHFIYACLGESLFKRNANVAASEVAQNVRKVGKRIKEKIDDILRPPTK
uniref:Uncharacterized protein n=1 Tax=Lactuca sativa TaxID=4236 RepID=A0A9R1WB26_LACSA|nr:hypothetical protein LSAT_V11C200077760 [Lactuca sativa]